VTSGGLILTDKGRKVTSGGLILTDKGRKVTSGGLILTDKGRKVTSGSLILTDKGRRDLCRAEFVPWGFKANLWSAFDPFKADADLRMRPVLKSFVLRNVNFPNERNCSSFSRSWVWVLRVRGNRERELSMNPRF
jgi:hypothetical protein